MKFYTYCVAESLPSSADTVQGLAGQMVQFMSVDELVVALSDFQGETVGVTRENVLRHEAVVRSVLAQTTPLPFRFGTLITEASLRSFISSRKKALLDRLTLVRDSVEMSVKIIWQQTSDDRPAVASQSHVGVGASFLLAKRQEFLGNDQLNAEAREISEWLGEGLRDLVREQTVNIQPMRKLVIAGSYLIDRSAESEFRASVSQMELKRPELHFLTSGPWPPYTFANIDLEFETQFGVS